ncbi:hypothetical protein [Bosea sp. BK604]|uniref:hypothetical protein n=1 Tax=Bosea sp. BK604 TaxID=2512180 RepID=UPI00104B005A|nr:hypothetical protein [Bosea sp. BK604]TCR65697.1 hypothetical protein EV560_105460 [Bosea sp. BK604]
MQTLANGTGEASREDGFKQMSRAADAMSSMDPKEGSELEGRGVDSSEAGEIDTDRIIEAADAGISGLQQLLFDKVRESPMRALGWAAAAGLFVGIMAAR